MIKADIRFLSGEVIRCVGRVRGTVGVPWVDEEDLRSHIKSIEGLEIVRIITE